MTTRSAVSPDRPRFGWAGPAEPDAGGSLAALAVESSPRSAIDLIPARRAPVIDPRSHAGQRRRSGRSQQVRAHDSIGTVARVMRATGLDSLPVLDSDGRILGVVTVDDLLGVLASLDSVPDQQLSR